MIVTEFVANRLVQIYEEGTNKKANILFDMQNNEFSGEFYEFMKSVVNLFKGKSVEMPSVDKMASYLYKNKLKKRRKQHAD